MEKREVRLVKGVEIWGLSSFYPVCGKHCLLCVQTGETLDLEMQCVGMGEKGLRNVHQGVWKGWPSGWVIDNTQPTPARHQEMSTPTPFLRGLMAGRELSGAPIYACFAVIKAEFSSLADRVRGGTGRGMSWDRASLRRYVKSEETPWCGPDKYQHSQRLESWTGVTSSAEVSDQRWWGTPAGWPDRNQSSQDICARPKQEAYLLQ